MSITYPLTLEYYPRYMKKQKNVKNIFSMTL